MEQLSQIPPNSHMQSILLLTLVICPLPNFNAVASTLLHTSGILSFTGSTHFSNYGTFQSSGTISFAVVASPTIQTFNNVTISSLTRLGGSTIADSLTLLPGTLQFHPIC